MFSTLKAGFSSRKIEISSKRRTTEPALVYHMMRLPFLGLPIYTPTEELGHQ